MTPEAAPPADPAGVTPPADAPRGSFVRATRTQKLIARRMVEAKTSVPEFTVALDVAMDAPLAARAALKEGAAGSSGGVVPSLNDMVIRAVALALRDHPRVNGSFDAEAGGFHLWDEVDVGFAVAAPDTLVVPVVRDADRRSLAEIAVETRALAAAVRDRTISPEQLAGGTFTVSNLGMLGIRHFEAVINPPQAAILAVGALRPTVVPARDSTAVATLMTVTLTSDHRIVYGADAAAFLNAVRDLLEEPGRL
ncbi:2-oxo acid dehydrogenase subunit E2 [Conexibacter stalactiti]|uniref:2-oxo acid dehydrogenase subunit E2 n=1 Tax=Conexibacter stalactiti TaxID=1940611 RepID=A0ABU4HJT5_9ACTN|nr:2-oxo acid dehydrogenase subunit E2 [Conexibacter stalactiti]MDW5593571.1 2-oxo acid dehydrogenase subunit E2 [Conexibacter stalactiti]MEC5034212.1 2-oxo acid dehydrogenase subunit E2 [Conexibacter stalactiti]